jgi:hypothetical protein
MKKTLIYLILFVLGIFLTYSTKAATCVDDDPYNNGACAQIISPIVDETVMAGETYTIQWTQENVNNVTIGYKTCDSCLDWIVFGLDVDVSQSTQSYDWVVPDNFVGRRFLIDITASGGANISDMTTSSAYITVVASNQPVDNNGYIENTAYPNINITLPSTNASLEIESGYNISWSVDEDVSGSFIELWLDMGENNKGNLDILPITPFLFDRTVLSRHNSRLNRNNWSYFWTIPASMDLSVVDFGSSAYSYTAELATGPIFLMNAYDATMSGGAWGLNPPITVDPGRYRIYAVLFNNNYSIVANGFSDYFNVSAGTFADYGTNDNQTNDNNTTNNYTPVATNLIKTVDDPAVYVIDDNGNKRLFVNSPTFWSHYSGSWSDIKHNGNSIVVRTISQEDFDNINIGANISVKPGVNLIRFQNSPRVYIVFGDNNLKYITNTEAINLFGSSWQDRLVTIQNGFENDYTRNNDGFIDSDNDGIVDDAEVDIYNTDPNSADSDGDEYNDGAEVLFGYDPSGSGRL